MLHYQKELEEVFRDYPDPGQNSYEPRVKITSAYFYVSMGPDYAGLAFKNGVYCFEYRHIIDENRGGEHKGEKTYACEEEAVYNWLRFFSYDLPSESETSKRVEEYKNRLYARYTGKQNAKDPV